MRLAAPADMVASHEHPYNDVHRERRLACRIPPPSWLVGMSGHLQWSRAATGKIAIRTARAGSRVPPACRPAQRAGRTIHV